MTDNQKSPQGRSGERNLWVRVLLPVAGFGLVVLLAWFFMKGTPGPPLPVSDKGGQVPPPQTLASQSAPADQPVAPAAPKELTPPLQEQLQQVISGLREANRKKDLSKLLSYYSSNFPGLPQRTQTISKAWKIYDYPKIDFELTDITPLPDHTVRARVTWNVEARNISTQKSENVSKTYLISFVKESGQWRIRSLETVK